MLEFKFDRRKLLEGYVRLDGAKGATNNLMVKMDGKYLLHLDIEYDGTLRIWSNEFKLEQTDNDTIEVIEK